MRLNDRMIANLGSGAGKIGLAITLELNRYSSHYGKGKQQSQKGNAET
jgi:hypothetical protein